MKKIVSILLCLIIVFGLISVVSFAKNDAPFTLKTESADGNEILPSTANNYTARLRFILSASEGGFGQAFTVTGVRKSNGKTFMLDTPQTVKANWSDCDFEIDVTFDPSDAEGKTVTFVLIWDNENAFNSVSATITTGISNPNASVRVNTDQLTVLPDSTITLTYEISNIGNVPLQYVTVTDTEVSRLLGVSYIYRANTDTVKLDVGKSIKKEITFQVGSSSITSLPSVTFAFEGKEHTVKGLETVINVNKVVPKVTLTSDSYNITVSGEEHTFTYKIENTTLVELKDIYVYDGDSETSSIVAGPLTIAPSEELEGTYKLKISKSGNYKVKLTYTYDGADETKTHVIKTEQAFRLPNNVTLSCDTITPNPVTQACDVTFLMKVTNLTETDLHDMSITVYDAKGNMLASYKFNIILAAAETTDGNSTTHPISVHVEEANTMLKFVLNYKANDVMDATQFAMQIPFNSVITAPTVEPTVTATPEPTDENGNNSNIIKLIIIFAAILLLIAIIIIVLLIIFKKNSAPKYYKYEARRKMNNDYDDGYVENNYDEQTDGFINYDDSLNEPEEDEYDDEGVKIYKKK